MRFPWYSQKQELQRSLSKKLGRKKHRNIYCNVWREQEIVQEKIEPMKGRIIRRPCENSNLEMIVGTKDEVMRISISKAFVLVVIRK